MTKYSDEFKLAAVENFLDGNSIKGVARELDIVKRNLQMRLEHYRAGGVEQLVHKNRKYSAELKKNIIEYKWEQGLLLMQTISADIKKSRYYAKHVAQGQLHG